MTSGSAKLPDQVRYLHGSLQLEKVYVYWPKVFVLGLARRGGGFRCPRAMGQAEVKRYLTMLATERRVAAATHQQQQLNASLFLYRQVLEVELSSMLQAGRSAEAKRISVVLTQEEVQRVWYPMPGDMLSPGIAWSADPAQRSQAWVSSNAPSMSS